MEATLKIGECFQELGMASEAKVFFDEVIEKSPDSKEAKKARIRLQALSK
ncbi:MAG: tetratricopeptide repeat protein [Bdellovibrionales bacterium]